MIMDQKFRYNNARDVLSDNCSEIKKLADRLRTAGSPAEFSVIKKAIIFDLNVAEDCSKIIFESPQVPIEIDPLGKYVEKMLERSKEVSNKSLLLEYFSISRKGWISIKDFQKLVMKVNSELHTRKLTNSYELLYNIDPEDIEMTVAHNSRIFSCDEDLIYLVKDAQVATTLDKEISKIVKDFIKEEEI